MKCECNILKTRNKFYEELSELLNYIYQGVESIELLYIDKNCLYFEYYPIGQNKENSIPIKEQITWETIEHCDLFRIIK